MKSSTAIICLIVCLSVFSSVEAKSNKTHGIIDQIFGDWNKAYISVYGRSSFSFECKIKDAYLQNDQSLGMVFDGFEQIGDMDKSGFMDYIVKLTQIKNQNLNKPVLDYRFVQNCAFSDNAHETFGDWRLEFDAVANEEYQIQENPALGQSWRVKVTLPSQQKSGAMAIKASFTKNCQNRNNVMNKLKENAIRAGSEYNSLHYGYINRQQSLDKIVALGEKTETVINDVKEQQAEQKQLIDTTVAANEAALKKALDELRDTASQKQTTEEQAEQFSERLSKIKSDLAKLLMNQAMVKRVISVSSQKLSEAIDLRNNQTKAKQAIEQKQQEIQSAAETERKEFEKLLQEIAEKQRLAQEANAKIVAAQKEALDELARKQAQINSDISSSTVTIDSLKIQIKVKSSQVQSIDEQAQQTRVTIVFLQEQINKKRSIANRFKAQIKEQQQELADQEEEARITKEENAKELEILKKREMHQISLLKDITEEHRKKEIYYAEQAQNDVKKAEASFAAALKAIVDVAQVAHVRTSRAQQRVLSNGHVQELSAVISNSQESMKSTLLRLAKYNRQLHRLAKARNSQMVKVRLQRTKLKNKLRTHKKHLQQ